MEIMPPKFRSPPPKPPRRRHSEQLMISSSGTYPSTRKKYHEENKLCIKEIQPSVENNSGCESLPANWITEFSSDYHIKNTLFHKNAPQGSSTHLKNSYQNFQIPISSVLQNENDGILVRNRDLIYLEQVEKSNILSSKSDAQNFIDCFQNDSKVGHKGIEIPSNCANYKTLDLKSYPKNYRRHNSDPVLSFLNSSNSKNTCQNYSLLGVSAVSGQSRLCNSLAATSGLKETQYLLEEVKTLKEINKKLWQHLCSTQGCLEERNCVTESGAAFSFSDLLSSLYCSQRAKDCAVEGRMKIILEERDAAIQELEDVIHVISRSFGDDTLPEDGKCSDKKIKELLKEIEVTCNPAKLLHQQRLLLTYLYRSKELKQDHLFHELKLAITEKDHLLEKVEYLKEEIKSLKLCNEVWNSENKHWERNLLNILCRVIQQRDVALLDTNVNQSLEVSTNGRSTHESSQTVELALKDHDSPQRYDDSHINVRKGSSLADVCKFNYFKESTSGEVGPLEGKIVILNKALQMEIEKRETVEEKCLRLERLVNVLQKKVNGQNVGISV